MVTGAQSRRAQALWAALDGQAVIQPADGMTLTTRDLDLAVSPPLPHGLEGTSMGYVVALTVTDHHEHRALRVRLGRAGPAVAGGLRVADPGASRRRSTSRDRRPTSSARSGAAAIERAVDHLCRIIDATGCRVIMDHHAVRDLRFAARFARLWETGRVVHRRRASGTGGRSRWKRGATSCGPPCRKPPVKAAPARAVPSRAIMTRNTRQIRERGKVRVSTPTDVTLNVGDPAPDFTLQDDRAQGDQPAATTAARTSSSSSIRSTGRRAEARACPPSTSAFATSRRPIPRYWVSRRTARSAMRTGPSRWASVTTRCSPTSTAPRPRTTVSTGRSGTPTCARPSSSTRAGTIRFIERYGRGQLPDPDQHARRGEEAR